MKTWLRTLLTTLFSAPRRCTQRLRLVADPTRPCPRRSRFRLILGGKVVDVLRG